MVIYFSGTGNSRYVAKIIQSVTNDELISMNELIKSKNNGILKSDKPFVFVCPTYALNIPTVVKEFIENVSFDGCKKAYFIMTCGGNAGSIVEYEIQQLCAKKEFEYMGFEKVIMPSNHITLFDVPDEAAAKKIINDSTPTIYKIAEKINTNQCLTINKVSSTNSVKSNILKHLSNAYYNKVDNPDGFYSTDKCVNCGKCANLCPLNNIELVNGKPQWGANCTHCMACICGCPKESIEFKNKTQGKPRYYLRA